MLRAVLAAARGPLSVSGRSVSSRAASAATPARPAPAREAPCAASRAVEAQHSAERGGRLPGAQVRNARLVWDDRVTLKLRRRGRMQWAAWPRRALLVYKHKDAAAAAAAREVVGWLLGEGLEVYVENECKRAAMGGGAVRVFHDRGDEAGEDLVDFSIVLGGDGTLLHLASLFNCDREVPVPPCVSFAMGSLGFMTNFDVKDYRRTLAKVLDMEEELYVTLRTRLRCQVWASPACEKPAIKHCLNEVVIDKGAHPGLGTLDCHVDGMHVTTVQADGLVISTPSGSTGYNMAVGGPIVAPSVPCTVLSPVAPHSLSFRPITVPESSKIEISIPRESRAEGYRAIFDGSAQGSALGKGGSVLVEPSLFPFPIINSRRYDHDWYVGLNDKLGFNMRPRPQPFGLASDRDP